MNDFDVLAHFQDVVMEIDRVVGKIIAKKAKKTSSSKDKSPVSRLVVSDSDDDDDDNDNDDDEMS